MGLGLTDTFKPNSQALFAANLSHFHAAATDGPKTGLVHSSPPTGARRQHEVAFADIHDRISRSNTPLPRVELAR